MRRLFVALALTGLVTGASAGEFELPDGTPVLRGTSPYVPAPPTYRRWEGIYGGGQIGFSRAGVDFGTSTNSLVSYILRNTAIESQVSNWTALAKGDTGSTNIGGFIGYNWQFDDVIIGFEGNYGHTNLRKAASDSLGRIFINNAAAPANHTYQYDITVAANASVQVTDMMTFRVRGGWVVDTFMAYAFVGGAVARANVSRSANVSGTYDDIFTDPVTGGTSTIFNIPLALPPTLTQVQTGAYTYGYTAGLGADYMIMPNVFVRGEWEFVQLPDLKGMRLSINTVRTAVGLKF
jgi:outer membrane immunogenic protein